MLKKDSEAWKLAKKLSRRKHVNSKPIELSECGTKVKFVYLLHGNTSWLSFEEMKLSASVSRKFLERILSHK